MRRILIMILLSVPGCYDLTFGEDDHVADELRVMAIHLTPPEIRYGEPIEAEVLFTDPEDGARPLWFAWRVLYPRTDGSGETEIETFVGTADAGGHRISVTPLEDAGCQQTQAATQAQVLPAAHQ